MPRETKAEDLMFRAKRPTLVLLAVGFLLFPASVLAQKVGPIGPVSQPIDPNIGSRFSSSDLEVTFSAISGAPIPGKVVVQILKANGQVFNQLSVKGGRARFNGVPQNEITVVIKAPGYQTVEKKLEIPADAKLMTIKFSLSPNSGEEAASMRGLATLNPKAQKDVGKALDALRVNRPQDARSHLEAAQKEVPLNTEVEYLFGVYASQLKDSEKAQEHWKKALALDPNHFNSLLGLSRGLLDEKKPTEAEPYLRHAAEVDPSSWRVQALLAEADFQQGNREGTVKHAERALELGHERAASVQILLARVLAQGGDKPAAIQMLQSYVNSNPSDAIAAGQLQKWKNPDASSAGDNGSDALALDADNVVASAATTLPTVSNWLPPDVDEKIPPVEAGASCPLDQILSKTGTKVAELIHDVDRFTATEWLVNENINRWGMPSSPEKRKFDYVVSIQEMRKGDLGVQEYRNSGGMPAEFPGGIITNGLPSLVLIFHPHYQPNYEMRCEGVTRWNGAKAYQVHFQQRTGKPIANKAYKIGLNGPSYAVALKGRAWISADSYQIVRMETDLAAPVPDIRLFAEHTVVEYSAVNFQSGNVHLWLPQSAEVFFDWRGHRIHRRHSFSDYMLFAVDSQEKVSDPKDADAPPDLKSMGPEKPSS
jgi:tetratricopeptide (TPR) repeat protein